MALNHDIQFQDCEGLLKIQEFEDRKRISLLRLEITCSKKEIHLDLNPYSQCM